MSLLDGREQKQAFRRNWHISQMTNSIYHKTQIFHLLPPFPPGTIKMCILNTVDAIYDMITIYAHLWTLCDPRENEFT